MFSKGIRLLAVMAAPFVCMSQAAALTISSHLGSGHLVIDQPAIAETVWNGGAGDIQIEPGSVITPISPAPQQVLYESVEFVNGTEANVTSLGGLMQGEYQLTLTDFVFPSAFEALGATISTATEVIDQVLLGDGQTQGILNFNIAGSDSYYLSVFGMASGDYNLGLYGIELQSVSVAAVPLPPAAFLMLFGLGTLAFVKRQKTRS